jgi:hypothetical protein
MTWLPEPVPLDFPPGDPAALAELLDTTAGAAFRLGLLEAHLAGPAAAAPRWLGADAAEATAQIATVTQLTGRVHAALSEALRRLAVHHDLLLRTRARVLALREEQREDFRRAAAVLDAVGDPQVARSAVPELIEAEAARRRAHAALLAEVTDDAAATSVVLAGAAAPVGGRARPGDADHVTATLAAMLPGWGDAELTARGREAGIEARSSSAEETDELLARDAALLSNPAYAVAWLSAVGPRAFRELLRSAADPDLPAQLTRRMTTVVAAAAHAGNALSDQAAAVLTAPLRRSWDSGTAVTLGRMARAGALPAAYLVQFVPSLLSGERSVPFLREDEYARSREDPLDQALTALALTGEASTVADMLLDGDLWPDLLARAWYDGTEGLTRVIGLAAEAPEAAALTATVLREVGSVVDALVGAHSLEALTLRAISPAVGDLVAENFDVVSDTIVVGQSQPAAAGRPFDGAEQQLLAGLGMVTLDPVARAAVLGALVAATGAAPVVTAVGAQSPAAYVHGGVFAAMAFGEAQEIRRQLYSAVARAESDELCWDVITAPLGFVPFVRLRLAQDIVTGATAFMGPGGAPLDAFLREPVTGARQAAFSALVASMPGLVQAGVLPDPVDAPDSALLSPEAGYYAEALSREQFDVLDDLVSDTNSGFQAVGEVLGVVPGSVAAPR